MIRAQLFCIERRNNMEKKHFHFSPEYKFMRHPEGNCNILVEDVFAIYDNKKKVTYYNSNFSGSIKIYIFVS